MTDYEKKVLNLYRDALDQTILEIKKQLEFWNAIGAVEMKYQDKKFLMTALESAIGFERYLWELTNITGGVDKSEE